jgi:hypothetical protein
LISGDIIFFFMLSSIFVVFILVNILLSVLLRVLFMAFVTAEPFVLRPTHNCVKRFVDISLNSSHVSELFE